MSFVCITPVGYLPLLRYVIPLFKEENVKIITTHIEGFYSFENIGRQKNIHVFPTVKHLNTHSKFVWLKKYFLIFLYILKLAVHSRKDIIYSIDAQVVAIAIMLRRIFKGSFKVVYHQFEILDPALSNGFNKKLQSYVINNAETLDLIIFPEVNRSQYFRLQSKNASYDSLLIPNTNNLQFNHTLKPGLTKGIPDDHVVIAHVGSIGLSHYIKEYISFIRSSQLQGVTFLFIGNMLPEVLEYLNFDSKNRANVLVINELPHSELLEIYNRINIGIILYKGVDLSIEYCAPNKLYEYWAHGIPVVAHKLTGLIPIWTHEFQGRLINFEDELGLSKAIEELITNWKKYKEPLAEYFAKELSLDQFLPILKGKVQSLF